MGATFIVCADPLNPRRADPHFAGEARLATPLGGGPGVVKDCVKTRKHEWDEACYVPDLAGPDRLAAVVARLVESQGDFLAGGVVVRAFERFIPGAGEARVWWVGDGQVSDLPAGADPAPLFTALAAVSD